MYRLLATLFLVIGGGFLVAVVVQAIFGARLIDAKALGPAVVLLVVGLLLVWTIRQLPPVTETDEAAAGDASAPRQDPPPERERGDGGA